MGGSADSSDRLTLLAGEPFQRLREYSRASMVGGHSGPPVLSSKIRTLRRLGIVEIALWSCRPVHHPAMVFGEMLISVPSR